MEALPHYSTVPGTVQHISNADLHRIRQWNRTIPTGTVRCLHELVLERANSQPEAIAIDAWDAVLTYRELALLSQELAQSLIASGVKHGTIVSLCFEKSAWTTVAMLGVLRAGAAFVLVDPALPFQRAMKMIKLVDSTVLITSRNVELDLSMSVSKVLFLHEDFFNTQPLSHTSIRLPVSAPQDLAIVLFTSGSTGSPKAILQDHRAASTTASGLGKSWNIGPESRVLQFASYVFDMSVIDTFMTLVNGACLCVPSNEDVSADPADVVQRMRINFSAVTASVASTYPAGIERTLRTLVLGGEKVPKSLIETWVDKLTLYNGYGPAEGSVCSFTRATTSRPFSIGLPLNTLAWVVDDTNHNKLVPIGKVGELLIEGPMLAKGYLRDEEKTRASFIEEPAFLQLAFGPNRKNQRRFYKTGDLVRQHEDGSLDYCGRKDLQTKLRGQRIELAEVEYNIQKVLPAGWTGIVDVVDLEAGATLFAFTKDDRTAQKRSEATTLPKRLEAVYEELYNELKTSLNSTLPSFMVPSSFWLVDEIPMTLSRKTDRSALKRLGKEAHEMELTQENCKGSHPDTVKDEEMVLLWKQWCVILHLGEKTIDTSANFFSLGGNSLLAMRLAGSLKIRFSRAKITVRQIFENPTLHLQSKLLKQVIDDVEAATVPRPDANIQPLCSVTDMCGETGFEQGEVEQVLEATDDQLVILWAELSADTCAVHHCVLMFDTALETSRLEQSLRTLMNQHSIFRTCFVPRKGKVFQVVLKNTPTDVIRVGVENLSREEDSNLDKYEIGLHRNALYLARWNLDSKEGRTRTVVLRISHAMFDGGYDGGFMHRILVELSGLYQGHAIPPSPPFSSYCAGRLAQLDAGIAYWKKTLAGATPSRLVMKRSPQDATILCDDVSRTVQVSALPSGITPASLVKAAWALVLSELLRTKNIVFAGLTSGRALPIEDAHLILGNCLGIIPNCIQISHGTSPHQFLEYVQNQYLEAIPYETVGLRTICRECTDWPRWEDLSTAVNDLSEENFIDRLDEDVDFGGGITCQARISEKPGKWVDVVVRSKKVGDTLHARLAFNEKVLPRKVVEEMNDMLVANVKMLLSDADELTPAPRGPVGATMEFPIAPPGSPTKKMEIETSNPISSEMTELVSEAWRAVFGPEHADSFDEPFFHKWPVACAYPLQKYFSRNGYHVTFDEVLAHPSKNEQAQLLAGETLASPDCD